MMQFKLVTTSSSSEVQTPYSDRIPGLILHHALSAVQICESMTVPSVSPCLHNKFINSLIEHDGGRENRPNTAPDPLPRYLLLSPVVEIQYPCDLSPQQDEVVYAHTRVDVAVSVCYLDQYHMI
jgi:hypothetical protein